METTEGKEQLKLSCASHQDIDEDEGANKNRDK